MPGFEVSFAELSFVAGSVVVDVSAGVELPDVVVALVVPAPVDVCGDVTVPEELVAPVDEVCACVGSELPVPEVGVDDDEVALGASFVSVPLDDDGGVEVPSPHAASSSADVAPKRGPTRRTTEMHGLDDMVQIYR